MLFGHPLAGHLVSLTTWQENVTKNHPTTEVLHWHKQLPELECIDFNNRRDIRCEAEGAENSLFCALVFLFNNFAHAGLMRAYPEPQDPVHIPHELPALATVPKKERHHRQLLRWLVALLGDLHQPLHWFQEYNYGRDLEITTKVNYVYEGMQDDCPGNDLQVYKDMSRATCENMCNSDRNCAGFSFSEKDPGRLGEQGCLTKSRACNVQAGPCNQKFCFWKQSKSTENASLLDVWESQLLINWFHHTPDLSVIQQKFQTNQLAWKHKRPTELFRDWAQEVATVVCDEIYGPMREAGAGIIRNPHTMKQDLYDRWASLAVNLTEIAGQRIAFILLDLAEHKEHHLAHALSRGRRHHTRHWTSDLRKNLLIAVLHVPLLLFCFRFFQEKSLGNKVWPFKASEEKTI